MKKILVFFIAIFLFSCTSKQTDKTADKTLLAEKVTLSKTELQDKIKGGWAGQVIGCTYGGPTEFRYNGIMIHDSISIPWAESRCLWYYENAPGLYDDVYMDLTFVDVFEKEGLDAPAESHALAFAHADYKLWHANQAARYNILNGIMPPLSGNWLYNPHAEDIDFQIEADFAGLMAPGMVNTASEICDKIGHIMNFGDGWYGGVYVAAMYSLAFVSNDVEQIVSEGLKAIPAESEFYQCINDVIQWHKKYPENWKLTWNEVQKKWSNDVGCPDGVFRDFNIDAKINAAYIVIGLLYGEGDYSKTLDISTRCGQDSDCNPASAGGILGTMMGYSNIPEYWRKGVTPVESLDFKYTTMSLNDVYETGTKHALEMLEKKGANIDNENIEIQVEKIKPVKLEVGFKNHVPAERTDFTENLTFEIPEINFEFEGKGFVLTGWAKSENEPTEIFLELYIDDNPPETFKMPTSEQARRHDVAWKYNLVEGKHQVKISIRNPQIGARVDVGDLIVYRSEKTHT